MATPTSTASGIAYDPEQSAWAADSQEAVTAFFAGELEDFLRQNRLFPSETGRGFDFFVKGTKKVFHVEIEVQEVV